MERQPPSTRGRISPARREGPVSQLGIRRVRTSKNAPPPAQTSDIPTNVALSSSTESLCWRLAGVRTCGRQLLSTACELPVGQPFGKTAAKSIIASEFFALNRCSLLVNHPYPQRTGCADSLESRPHKRPCRRQGNQADSVLLVT